MSLPVSIHLNVIHFNYLCPMLVCVFSDHIKTVTFANKPQLHHFPKGNVWDDPYRDIPRSYNHYQNNYNKNLKLTKPSLPTRDYISSPRSSQSSLSRHAIPNTSTFGNKLLSINDSSSHMTSYDEDDETTTSGSYTIDNDLDWMNETPQKRPYFLSHNEAYC